MDKLEYIPGDFVMTNGVPLGTAKDVVYRVTSSDPTKTLKLDDGTVLKGAVCLENIEGAELGDKGYLFGDCCAWVKDIVPIPLTSEILEKNEWRKEEENYFNDSYHIFLECKYEKYSAYKVVHNDVVWLRDVRSVSDLQHFLFGLGINHEMEV
jgi:hypothetical protein